MKYSLPIILFVFITNSAFSQKYILSGGTTVITIVTKDSVVIAADSKSVDMGNTSNSDTITKIKFRENIFYTGAGGMMIMERKNNKTWEKETTYNVFE